MSNPFGASATYTPWPEWQPVDLALEALQRARIIQKACPSLEHAAAVDAAQMTFVRAYAALPARKVAGAGRAGC